MKRSVLLIDGTKCKTVDCDENAYQYITDVRHTLERAEKEIARMEKWASSRQDEYDDALRSLGVAAKLGTTLEAMPVGHSICHTGINEWAYVDPCCSFTIAHRTVLDAINIKNTQKLK